MSNVLACYQLLELNVISAQDLAPAGRSMRTYAVAWIDPDRKLSTRVDSHGATNPTWNDKFVFRIDQDFLYDDESTITIDIYALHWFKDIHVGTAHILSTDLLRPPSQPHLNTNEPMGLRFMGLEVLRPSGRPKGILNIGVAILDSSMRSMPLYTRNPPAVGFSHDDHNHPIHQTKPQLRRTKSDCSSMLGSEAIVFEYQPKAKREKVNSQVTPSETKSKSKSKASSRLSGSYVKGTPKKGKKKTKTSRNSQNSSYNGRNSPASGGTYNSNNNYKGNVIDNPLHAFVTENATMEYGTPYRSNMGRRPFMTDSELGPSASEVAAVVARLPIEEEEEEKSAMGGWNLAVGVEGLQPKVERWQAELPTVYDCCERSELSVSSKKEKHSPRQTDGGNGMFSCFSVICGVECSIVCGGRGGNNKKSRRRRRVQAVDNESFL